MKIQTIISIVFPVLILYFLIHFIIAYNTGGEIECDLLCGGVGTVYKDGDKCLCDCPEGYEGENCESIKSGYFREEAGVSRTTKCNNRHRLYAAKEATEYTDTVCKKCPDGYYADGDDCRKCTDCDGEPGKYFKRACLNNSDAQCGAKSCGDDEYVFDATTCKKHTTCDKYYRSKGTQSYDAKCTDQCLTDEYATSSRVCTKCTVCDEMTEIETAKCTKDQDRVCQKCPPGHYVKDGECVPTTCPDGWWYDGARCRRCIKCEEDGFVYEKKCGVANDSVCAKKCGFDGQYLYKDLDGDFVCAKCKTCASDEFEAAPCEVFSGGDIRETKDTVCVSKGFVGNVNFAESKCANCQIGQMNPDFYFNPANAYRKCRSDNACSTDADCYTGDDQTGRCDIEDGRCEMRSTYYCGGSGKCGEGKCSDRPSGYYPSLLPGGADEYFPPEMIPSSESAPIPGGRIKVKLDENTLYESKGTSYDWGDSCYVEDDESYKCVLNLSYMEKLRDMVCEVGNPEYNATACAKIQTNNNVLECQDGKSCIVYE